MVADPTIGGGTQFDATLLQLLNQLGGEQGNRAQVQLQIAQFFQDAFNRGVDVQLSVQNFLENHQQFATDTNLSLLNTLISQQQGQANTGVNLLGQMQSGRLGEGALANDIMRQLQSQREGAGGLQLGLLGSLQQGRATSGNLGLGLLGQEGDQRVAQAQQLGSLARDVMANAVARGGQALDAAQLISSDRMSRGGLGNNLLQTLNQNRATGAGIAQNLLNPLMAAEQQARSSPLNIVDLLAQGGQFGTTLPLSQMNNEQLTQYGYKPGHLTNDLINQIKGYANPMTEQQGISDEIRALMQEDPRVAQATQGAINAQTTPDAQSQSLIDQARGNLTPGAAEQSLADQIRGFMNPTPQETNITDTFSQQFTQPTAQEQQAADTALNRTSPQAQGLTQAQAEALSERGYSMDEIINMSMQNPEARLVDQIIAHLQPTQQQQSLVGAVQTGTQQTPQQTALTGDILNKAQNPVAPQAVAPITTAQTYGQGAVPQARILDVYPDGMLLVQLQDGTVDLVRKPVGTGVVTMQGQQGPFSINVDEANTRTGETPKHPRADAETIVAKFRSGTTRERADLIGFLNADAATQKAIGNYAATPAAPAAPVAPKAPAASQTALNKYGGLANPTAQQGADLKLIADYAKAVGKTPQQVVAAKTTADQMRKKLGL